MHTGVRADAGTKPPFHRSPPQQLRSAPTPTPYLVLTLSYAMVLDYALPRLCPVLMYAMVACGTDAW
eukprot:2753420-Rhodomonas_salina.2